MRILSDDFLQETIRVWQPHAAVALSPEDAREIIENMTGFLTILAEWQENTDDTANPVPPKKVASL